MQIDDDAKLRVALFRLTDDFGNPYFIGKLQFPGTMNFEKGASFMVFCSEQDMEELQIGPIDESKRSSKIKRSGNSIRATDKIRIDMHPCIDGHKQKFYVGEAKSIAHIDCTPGVFFTFFFSKEGREELQIGRLKHRRKDSPHESGEHDLQTANG